MGSLISKAHQERVHSFVEGAREEGGKSCSAASRASRAFYPATVVAGVRGSSTIAREEVFGPVITIIPFEDEKDAIKIANDVRYRLMASVWTGVRRVGTASLRGSGGNGRDQHALYRRGCRSAATSSRASVASSGSRRSTSTSGRRRDRQHRLAPDQPFGL